MDMKITVEAFSSFFIQIFNKNTFKNPCLVEMKSNNKIKFVVYQK
jgi:hypothetical protein